MSDEELLREGETWGRAAAAAALQLMQDANGPAEIEAIATALWDFLDEHVVGIAEIAGARGAALFEEVATAMIEELLAAGLDSVVPWLH